VVKWGVGSGNLWPNQLLNLMGNDLIDRWHNQPWTEVVGSLTNSNVQQIIDNWVQSIVEKDPSSVAPAPPEPLQDQVTEIIEDNLPNFPPAPISQVVEAPPLEQELWTFILEPQPTQFDITVIVFKAVWSGPQPRSQTPFSLQKSCQVRRLIPDPEQPEYAISEVTCTPAGNGGLN
jgi:hypothetical protein